MDVMYETQGTISNPGSAHYKTEELIEDHELKRSSDGQSSIGSTSISDKGSVNSSIISTCSASEISRVQSTHSTQSNDKIWKNSSNSEVKDLPFQHDNVVELQGKISRRIQFIAFSLVSIAAAFAVMIIWYNAWLKENQIEEKQSKTTNQSSKSNTTCPFWEITGDGYCDDQANIPECGYDFSDCCQAENDRNICQNCTCHLSGSQIQGFKAENCEKSHLMKNMSLLTTNHAVLDYMMYLGDGTCNPNYNKAEYFFDIGDCCMEMGPDTICQYVELETQERTCVPCPENQCIISNNFCIAEELGDGICQDHNNGPYCEYDMGDCLLAPKKSKDGCCYCYFRTTDTSNFLGCSI